MNQGIFEHALQFAMTVHAGMTRRSAKLPYILHPLEAACIASTMTQDEEVLAAALLHDVVEDTPTTLAEVEEHFGPRVAELVAAETENKRRDQPPADTWQIRKEESLAELRASGRDVKILWLADKLSNARSFYRSFRERGSAIWNDFNMKDPKAQAWYYTTISDIVRDELSDEMAWIEYDYLVREIFREELS